MEAKCLYLNRCHLAPTKMQYAEPCQLLHAAAALLEGVAAYFLWLQQQQNRLRNAFVR